MNWHIPPSTEVTAAFQGGFLARALRALLSGAFSFFPSAGRKVGRSAGIVLNGEHKGRGCWSREQWQRRLPLRRKVWGNQRFSLLPRRHGRRRCHSNAPVPQPVTAPGAICRTCDRGSMDRSPFSKQCACRTEEAVDWAGAAR
jgi:hypothetical protein